MVLSGLMNFDPGIGEMYFQLFWEERLFEKNEPNKMIKKAKEVFIKCQFV